MLLVNRAVYKKLVGHGMEHHHIIPVCMGGTDDKTNLVALTPSEHLVAHRLLTKIFPEEQSIQFAYFKMCFGDYLEHGINNKIYRAVCIATKDYNYMQYKLSVKQSLRKQREFDMFKFAHSNKSTKEVRQHSLQHTINYLTPDIVSDIATNATVDYYRLRFVRGNASYHTQRLKLKLDAAAIAAYRHKATCTTATPN